MSDRVRWGLGLLYIFLVAIIWIAASFVVQSVVDKGVSPFLVTYICNSLLVIYVPIVEIGRYIEDSYGSLLFWRKKKLTPFRDAGDSEEVILLGEGGLSAEPQGSEKTKTVEEGTSNHESGTGSALELESTDLDNESASDVGLDSKGRWTRMRVAKASLVICPFWFLAQLSFNLSLKYTTVTSNTILSSSSSLFTFLVSLAFLGEKFTWLKLVSVLLCMSGTVIVSLGDSESERSPEARNPLLGDLLSLLSAAFYAVYVTLIRKKLPDDDGKSGQVSMAQVLGFVGLFNFVIFLPVALVLNFAKLEPFNVITLKEFGLVVGKGLLDNVLSDYLWAKAVLLTTTTVATAGLTIQVPLAAVMDTITGNTPSLMDYIGAIAVMVGFTGINLPTDNLGSARETLKESQALSSHEASYNHSTDDIIDPDS